MTIVQLIKYNISNIFLEKLYTKCCGETIPRSFFKKNQNWKYLWISSLKTSTVCFCCMPSWGLSIYFETKLQTKLFQETKRGFELALLPHFLYDFWRKIFLLLFSMNWPNLILWLPLLREILSIWYILRYLS